MNITVKKMDILKIWGSLVDHKIVDHSDVIGAGAAPITSSFST